MPVQLPPRIMWSAVTNPKDPKNWVLLRFKSKKILEIAGSGTGGRAECVANLIPNEVMFGGFVVYGVDQRGGVTSQRAKFIHFAWVGPKVPIMQRSRASSMGSDISDWFGGAHITLRVGPTTEELDEQEITQKLINTGGAHKPKLYDFGGNLGPRSPEAIKKGPSETSDAGSSDNGSSSSGEQKTVATDQEAAAEAARNELEAEKKREEEQAAAEAAAQKAAMEAKKAADKKQKEEEARIAAAAKSEKAENAQREKAAQEAKAAADAKAATSAEAKPTKQRRLSISEVKAAQLMGTVGPRAILLTSSVGGSGVESKERRVKDLFLAFNVAHEVIDGANKDLRDRRNELFDISGIRGNYPQIFVVGKGDSTASYVGDSEKIVELSDSSKGDTSSGEPTFSSVFKWAVEGYSPSAAPVVPEAPSAAPATAPVVETKNSKEVAASDSSISSDPSFLKLLTQVNEQLSRLEGRVGISGGGTAAPKPAPAPAKNKAAPAPATETEDNGDTIKKAALAKNNLFAELAAIDQSSGKTAGLRQTKKVNGKRIVENDKSNVMTEAKKKKIAKMRGLGGGAKKGTVEKTKPPICELRGKKWAIENQVGMCTLDEDKCNKKQTVYIFNCKGATIQILGKVNMITVDKCTKTNVVFNDVMGGCELVNCKQTKVQANGQCATVAIDKTDGCVVYAGKVCWENLSIVASKSSEMNVSWPGETEDDAWNEACIPEQYQHKIREDKVTCEVSDLYTH
jgi:hypothetical protein